MQVKSSLYLENFQISTKSECKSLIIFFIFCKKKKQNEGELLHLLRNFFIQKKKKENIHVQQNNSSTALRDLLLFKSFFFSARKIPRVNIARYSFMFFRNKKKSLLLLHIFFRFPFFSGAFFSIKKISHAI